MLLFFDLFSRVFAKIKKYREIQKNYAYVKIKYDRIIVSLFQTLGSLKF